MWTGVYAPPVADETVEHLEMLITNITNDKVLTLFMQAVQSAELIAIMKSESMEEGEKADHMPVQVPNTINKVGDKIHDATISGRIC